MSEAEMVPEEYDALMQEALPVARDATSPGRRGLEGAKGGTRAILGRALLATLARAERAEAAVLAERKACREIAEDEGNGRGDIDTAARIADRIAARGKP